MKIEDETQSLIHQVKQPQSNLKSIVFSQMDHIIQSKDIPFQNRKLKKQLEKAKFLPDGLIESDYYQDDELITLQLRRLFSKNFMMIGMLKFISIVFLFFTPVLMQQLTNSLNQSLKIFAYYSLGLLASTFLSAITDTQYNYQIKQLEIKSKAFLTEKIYLSLDSCSKSDVLNLINIDINSVINFFISFHECWSLILKLLIGLSILYIQIQEAVFVGFITALILMTINFAIARKIGIYYSNGLVYKDQRMKLLKEFAQHPKSIKFLKWEEKQEEKIQKVRSNEFKYHQNLFRIIEGSKWLDSMCVLFWAITNTMISTITLYVYSQKNQLNDVFTIIYLFSLLTNPLNSLPWTVSGMLQAKTSFERINEFVIPILRNNNKQKGISINQAELKWKFDDSFVLQINHFQPKKLNFIIGSTKSGKTSFILSLLNQMKTKSGYFEVNSKFSYVSQQHWVCSGSVRNNILMGSEFNEVYYKQCLNESQLIDDILLLEDQDFFDVGPQGQKLSGGQKQRLSICRALYNNRDIFLFDDIFSSLDPQVADNVFQNIIKREEPIIMVLNDAYLLRYLQYSDQIILLQNGTLIYDQQLIKTYIDKLNPIDLKNLISPSKQHNQDIYLVNDYSDEDNTPIVKHTKQSIQFYLEKLGTFNLIWITISLILMQISFNLYDYWLNSYINGSAVFLISSSFTITIFGLTLIDFIIKSSRAFSFAYGNLNQAQRIFNNLLHNVIYAKCSFYDQEESGQILTRFSDDQNVVDNRFPFELNILCNNIVNFFGTFIILITLQWYLVFPTIISIFIFYKLQQKYRPTSLPLRRLESQTNSQLVNEIFQQYQGIIIIKAFNKQQSFKQLFTNSLLNSIRASWASKVLALWLQLRLQFVAGFIVFCILVLAFISLYFDLPISSSTLQLLLYYSLTKIGLFRDLTLSMTTCEQELISYERIQQYCSMEIEQNQLLNQSDQLDLIQLQNVSLQYNDGTVALNNITLSIQSGSRIAFCGRTGSGKSSILSAIYFLYPYQKGDIRVPAKTIEDWRAKVGVIPQNGYVFDGSLKDNLNHEDAAKIKEIMNLDPNQHIDPSTISQGFRQLISFARVMLQNCEVIFMDEATASVDQKIEEYIHKYLRVCGKTIITISHRLEALQDYDKIFYLEKGQIKEVGTFEELIKLKGGFSKLRNI